MSRGVCGYVVSNATQHQPWFRPATAPETGGILSQCPMAPLIPLLPLPVTFESVSLNSMSTLRISGRGRRGVRVATGFCTPFSTIVLRVTTVQSGSNLLMIIHSYQRKATARDTLQSPHQVKPPVASKIMVGWPTLLVPRPRVPEKRYLIGSSRLSCCSYVFFRNIYNAVVSNSDSGGRKNIDKHHQHSESTYLDSSGPVSEPSIETLHADLRHGGHSEGYHGAHHSGYPGEYSVEHPETYDPNGYDLEECSGGLPEGHGTSESDSCSD